MRTSLHTRRTAAPTIAGLGSRSLVDAQGRAVDLRAAAEGSGTFEGYACLWDTTDSYGTRFAPGSFGAGGLDADPYALLWMHDPYQPRGIFTAREDDIGLFIGGGWDDDAEGQSARARAKSGSAPELSVGFRVLAIDPEDEQRFTQVVLVEVSQITRRMASVPGAGFSNARGVLLEQPADEQDDPTPEVLDADRERRRRATIARLKLARG